MQEVNAKLEAALFRQPWSATKRVGMTLRLSEFDCQCFAVTCPKLVQLFPLSPLQSLNLNKVYGPESVEPSVSNFVLQPTTPFLAARRSAHEIRTKHRVVDSLRLPARNFADCASYSIRIRGDGIEICYNSSRR